MLDDIDFVKDVEEHPPVAYTEAIGILMVDELLDVGTFRKVRQLPRSGKDALLNGVPTFLSCFSAFGCQMTSFMPC